MKPHHSLITPRQWLRQNLFSDPFSSATTVLLLAAGLYWLPGLVDWLLLKAVFRADANACRALDHAGACWGVVAEKYRMILFGRYPYAEQWRPLLASSLLLLTLFFSWRRGFGWRGVLSAGLLALTAFVVLMRGGVLGLEVVGSDLWGGLPLTLLLTALGMLLAFPLSLLIAIIRTSQNVWLTLPRSLCLLYVELVRGVPLISVLFLASFLFPLLLPPGVSIDTLIRVQIAIALFAAAYLSETLRGGLQSVSPGQSEAAASLGLTPWQSLRWIVLPQALRACIPSILNSAVSLFKDTSLVTIVSLYELTGSLSLALAGDPEWRSFALEGYLFIGLIYWIGCYGMSRFGARLERGQN